MLSFAKTKSTLSSIYIALLARPVLVVIFFLLFVCKKLPAFFADVPGLCRSTPYVISKKDNISQHVTN